MSATHEYTDGATVVVACDPNGVIAVDGKIPWDCPEERAHFKRVTIGRPVIMGRRTFESLPDKHRPLDGRINVILTHDAYYRFADHVVSHIRLGIMTQVADSLDVALKEYPQAMVIGGADVYEQALRDPRVTRILMSKMRRPVSRLLEGERLIFPISYRGDQAWEERFVSSHQDFSVHELRRRC